MVKRSITKAIDEKIGENNVRRTALSPIALDIRRGTIRSLTRAGYACLIEVPLPNHRRADIFAIEKDGRCCIIEVKSGLPDFKSDQKWQNYLEFCDEFYFAVAPDFPVEEIPSETGLIIADAYRAEIMRPSPISSMAPQRRQALLRKIARLGALRLTEINDPSLKTGLINGEDV